MKNKLSAILIALAALLPLTLSAAAQSGGGYNLEWNTFDAGGHTFSSGGGYTLGGTLGQADAGAVSGGVYSLSGGFWGGGAAAEYHLYLPLVLRNAP